MLEQGDGVQRDIHLAAAHGVVPSASQGCGHEARHGGAAR
jgi:hypothetical protein